MEDWIGSPQPQKLRSNLPFASDRPPPPHLVIPLSIPFTPFTSPRYPIHPFAFLGIHPSIHLPPPYTSIRLTPPVFLFFDQKSYRGDDWIARIGLRRRLLLLLLLVVHRVMVGGSDSSIWSEWSPPVSIRLHSPSPRPRFFHFSRKKVLGAAILSLRGGDFDSSGGYTNYRVMSNRQSTTTTGLAAGPLSIHPSIRLPPSLSCRYSRMRP